jgi:hypothetical protein
VPTPMKRKRPPILEAAKAAQKRPSGSRFLGHTEVTDEHGFLFKSHKESTKIVRFHTYFAKKIVRF